ncbi:WD40 repeat-like protein [Ramicandelaber brevisporus]|nr:WD40 repeat-like protein [Ramicandelaber brevisporus]
MQQQQQRVLRDISTGSVRNGGRQTTLLSAFSVIRSPASSPLKRSSSVLDDDNEQQQQQQQQEQQSRTASVVNTPSNASKRTRTMARLSPTLSRTKKTISNTPDSSAPTPALASSSMDWSAVLQPSSGPTHRSRSRHLSRWSDRSATASSRSLMPWMRSLECSEASDILPLLYEDATSGYLGRTQPYAFNFNADGSRVAICDERGSIHIADANHASWPSLSQTTVATGSADGYQSFSFGAKCLYDVAWLGPGRSNSVVSCGFMGSIGMVDVQSGKTVAKFIHGADIVRCVAPKPKDGHVFASTSRDGSVRIWDVRCTPNCGPDGTLLHRPVDTILNAHLPSSITATLHQSTPTTKRRSGQQQLARQIEQSSANGTSAVVSAVFMAHNEHLLATAGVGDGRIKYWDLRYHGSHTNRQTPVPSQQSTSLQAMSSSQETAIPDLKALQSMPRFTSLALSPDGTRLFGVSRCNSIFAYDTGALQAPLYALSHSPADGSDPRYTVASQYLRAHVSPDSSFLAAGSSDGNVFVWDLRAAERHAVCPSIPASQPLILSGHERMDVPCVRWQPSAMEQNMLVSCSDDGTLRRWHTRL